MRARNLKPGFFSSGQVVKCDPLGRILFAGLWCAADRDGRLKDDHFDLKIKLLPGDNCDANTLLQQLHDNQLIVRYEVEGQKYIQINEFLKHQKPHLKEATSTIPALDNPRKEKKKTGQHLPRSVPAPTQSGKEAENFPSSLIPSSLIASSTEEGATQDARAPDSAFKKIYDAGSAAFPNLATANTSAIHAWISAGADPDLDAVPEIQRHAGKQIRAWSYFTGGIMDAKATRTTPAPEGKPHANRTLAGKPTKDERARAAVMRGLGLTG